MDFLEKQFRYVSYFIQCCCVHTYYFILTTGKRPELDHLVELLVPISSKWDLIGKELGVDINFIDDLNKSDFMKLNEVIQKWIETKPTPTTWNNIIEVVKGPILQNLDVASAIEEYLDEILTELKQATVKSMQRILYIHNIEFLISELMTSNLQLLRNIHAYQEIDINDSLLHEVNTIIVVTFQALYL